ncbi:MAG: hypothetical protein KKH80_03235 [Candidatus Omnitrophica bacterium]|nr:hypothetical protein [Candidatus Omnitrophota bacterium]
MIKNKNGFSLIIVIFAMMLLAVLGWSLAVLQSSDFESSARLVNSESALYLAEAGGQWGLKQLIDSFECSDSVWGSLQTVIHSFPNLGQYEVNCDCPTCPGLQGNPQYCNGCSEIVITSTGYIPSQSSPRALRKVEVTISQGLFSNVVSGGTLFNWHNTGGHYVDIDGDLQSPNFEGDDADSFLNEEGQDYGPNLPAGDGTRTRGPTSMPAIDMSYFEDYAANVKGQVFNGNRTFDHKDNLNNKGVYYVRGRVTLDVSGGDINANHTTIISEGDIRIQGAGALNMKAYVDSSAHETLPNLATENGDIIFFDDPAGATDNQKRDARKFDGLIFTRTGDVIIRYINGVAVMGLNIELWGSIELEYNPRYVDTQGFIRGTIEVMDWKEQ